MNDKDKNDARFHILQPNRDPESNWTVNVAKELEAYLLEICSGDEFGNDGRGSVNFAEAALLLQGSIQVYSRKVEYLYNLVLHALEFISQKRQDQQEKTSIQPDGNDANAVADQENEEFLSLDDIPVEPKIDLVGESSEDVPLNHFVKPPANLLVLEGDCLDASGDGGELESYLLASNNLYEDFLLLDPCDAGAIYNLKVNDTGVGHTSDQRGSLERSKSRRSFIQSPSRKSGTGLNKLRLGKDQDNNPNKTPGVDVNNNTGAEPHGAQNLPHDNFYDGENMFPGCQEHGDNSDDDPWMPLNPHEPGDLKVKPFKKGNFLGRKGTISTKPSFMTSKFPLARLHGTISSEFAEALDTQRHACTRPWASRSPPPYEKLRCSLVSNGDGTCNHFGDLENENEDYGFENDEHEFEEADVDLPHGTHMEAEVSLPREEETVGNLDPNTNDAFDREDLSVRAGLEDLCRSHLDALLANIAEAEKQTELASRVSTWKQRIEHDLDEQDSRPPFDIHAYGERVLDKLSLAADREGCMSFSEIVGGQPKHEIARTFSALLQLVNNGNVALNRGANSSSESVCFTGVNPFCVKLLSSKKREEEMLSHKIPFMNGKLCPLKRTKSVSPSQPKKKSSLSQPAGKQQLQAVTVSSPAEITPPSTSLHSKSKFSLRNGIRCTPEGKRRRRSGLIKPVDVESAR